MRRHRKGDAEGARRGYERAIRIDPGDGDAHGLLAMLETDLGRLAVAEGHARKAISASPDDAVHYSTLGNIERLTGRLEAAEATLRKGLDLDARLPQLHVSLGLVHHAAGRRAEAMACYVAALRIDATCAEAHLQVGYAFHEDGDTEGAIAAYEQAAACAPGLFDAALNLSNALALQQRFEEAVQAADRALRILPNAPPALLNRGAALAGLGEYDEAASTFARVTRLAPGSAEAFRDLGGALYRAGRMDEAIDAFRNSLALQPDAFLTRSTYLFCLNYRETDPTALREAHDGIAPIRIVSERPRVHGRAGRLRVGYVSPDFRRHSVAHFAAGPIERRDRGRFEVVCYHTSRYRDAWTERFRGWADAFVEAGHLSDEALAKRIAEDQIDVLIDLAGHTGGTRLPVFARRPATVQIGYLGYPTRTGAPYLDYRLTDRAVDPRPRCIFRTATSASGRKNHRRSARPRRYAAERLPSDPSMCSPRSATTQLRCGPLCLHGFLSPGCC